MKKKVFVTGGAGYIGSHTCVELLNDDYEVLIYDSFHNSSHKSIDHIQKVTGKEVGLCVGDIRDKQLISDEMVRFKPHCVVHFAGLKSVSESVLSPLDYYDVNVSGTVNVLEAMSAASCQELIFSSSATVYSSKKSPPYKESDPTEPSSPYGRTKLICEGIINDWVKSGMETYAVILRYFNPVGAHSSGLLGESLDKAPNNLMPIISQVAAKKQKFLSVYGNDYETRDGTGERDYIHVVDLALGHVRALKLIKSLGRCQLLNLGTGMGVTVSELVQQFEEVNSVKINFDIVGRRAGDVARSIADPTNSKRLLNFVCQKNIKEMCKDAWNRDRKILLK